MANIRTLRDLENGSVGAQPVPNPWRQQQQPGGRTAAYAAQPTAGYGYAGGAQGSAPPYGYSQQAAPVPQIMMHDAFWSPNIPPNQAPTAKDYACMCCCGPCCVGPCCSETRKKDYRRALMTFTGIISVIQVIYFIISLCFEGFAPYSVNPSVGPPPCILDMMGAKDSYRMRYGFEIFRFLSPVLIHAGIFHIFFNIVIVQLRMGLILETMWGWKRILGIYLISGIGATLMSCLLSTNNLSVGASGAILGLFGARLAEIIAKWNYVESAAAVPGGGGYMSQRNQELMNLIMVIVICFLLGTSPYVDSAAHLGGFVTGLLVGFALFSQFFVSGVNRRVFRVFGILGLSVFLAVGFAAFYTKVEPMRVCERYY